MFPKAFCLNNRLPVNDQASPLAMEDGFAYGHQRIYPASTLQRTQSMDPPQFRAISLSRDVSMEDGVSGTKSRDVTMSPSRPTAFKLRARSSLTPQPTGQGFGPKPQFDERDKSEPPPLSALMTKPQSVKAPFQTNQIQREPSVTTLGTIVEASGRASRSPMRQHSGLFLGARPGSIVQSTPTPIGRAANAAEQALQGLDVYKTPLLPSRLRGSQTIPEMFKPKKAHAPVLMRSERGRDRKPRLGVQDRRAEEIKPYTAKRGRGTREMIKRRKLEEQEELEKERANAIEADEENLSKPPFSENTTRDVSEALEAAMSSKARTVGGRDQSSLRVGRSRTGPYIPRSAPKNKNRFSAAYEDEDGDDSMLDEGKDASEETAKFPTVYESPKNFSFAPEKAPVLHDSSNAREPPIASLPFSFAKPMSAAPSAPVPPFSFAEPPKAPQTLPVPQTPEQRSSASYATEVSPLPAVPSISLIPPSPAPNKASDETSAPTSSTNSSVPNFFANSTTISKAPAVTAPFSFAPASSASEEKGEVKTTVPSSFNLPLVPKESVISPPVQAAVVATPAPFSFNQPSTNPGTQSSLFSFPSASTKNATTSNPPPSLFTPIAPVSAKEPAPSTVAPAPESKLQAPPAFSFAPPSTTAESAPAASGVFNFGAPSTTTTPAVPAPAPPATNLFSFGKPAGATSVTTTATSTAPSFSFGVAPADSKGSEVKSLFGGKPEASAASLFGATSSAPAPSTSLFGVSQKTPVVEAPKPFAFGQPTALPSTPASTIEAPKSLFPSTSTGSSGGFSFAPASSPTPQLQSPFAFNASPSTPPVTTPADNKSSFTFGTASSPSVSAPTTLFGGPSNNSQDGGNKGFSFGAPARPVTPPQKEQEMRMEESPTHNNGMEMSSDQPAPSLSSLKPAGGFFGSGPSPFGQPASAVSSPFGFGAKNEVKPEVKTSGSFASFGQNNSSPFGFGKPGENTQPSLASPFGAPSNPFGSSSTPTTTPTPFSFGGANSGFGSQPTSPSTFGQPASAPFSFGATPTSATAPSNPFAFGSQPASPATGNSGLPQPPGSAGNPFSFGASSPATSQAPSSPFGAPPTLPTPAGGVSFTMGSAAPPPQAGGARSIKKLPNRRGIPPFLGIEAPNDKMRFQLLSDLHMEVERPPTALQSNEDSYTYTFPADETADALALVGDVGTTNDERMFGWIRTQLQRFNLVFFLPGNHEYHHSSIDESRERVARFAAECAAARQAEGSHLGRFVLLDRGRHDVSPTLSVLGCTLWAQLEPAQHDAVFQGVRDFTHIRGFTLDTFHALHAQDLAWLEASIAQIAREEPQRTIVVMTHHAPTHVGTSNPAYAGSPKSSAFSTELVGGPCWVSQVKVWMYGHTHWNCDAVREGVRVVSNQRGYKDGAPGYDPAKVIEIGD
ncbi:uncharacterized protein BXZ73DRAFT_95833 [Epithele typhae]|uniref:uncharacterized protein n=1 Tax=Epithele typhae TaxID=378194 RepID=UPI0020074DCB|nr:uncharacterized protein BXZ73DRAFT_95833 [Epithele typhae]KAH9946333.1 hypothetical protein BXZ73DRAFT_95833 [Epithele typhae]